MKLEEMQALTSRIQEKLGEENTALISDDLGLLITDTKTINQNFETKNKEIEKLKQDKENLINTNGKLLQQVSVGIEEPRKKDEEEKTVKTISFKDCFDEKGNFI